MNTSTKKKPNILFITTDQHHFTTMGINNPKINTPNLDRLAAQGKVFHRTYCPNPTCTPSRASMITGLYPSQHGAYSLGTKMLPAVPVIGDLLQQNAYRTALIGKAHFEPLKETDQYRSLESYPIMQDADFWRDFNGPYYGFEHVELARNHTNEAHVGEHYALWLEDKGFENWRDFFMKPTGNQSWSDHLRQGHHWAIPEEYHYDAWIAERSNALLEEFAEKDENFFLWASFLDPHGPYILPEPWLSMYDSEDLEVPEAIPHEHDANPYFFKLTQIETGNSGIFGKIKTSLKMLGKTLKLQGIYKDFRSHHLPVQGLHGMHIHNYNKEKLRKRIAAYYGMVSLLDKYIGVILDKLDSLGLAENTIVVFTTDHGDFFGQHGLVTKGPFHYEDLLRIPFIVRYPNVIPNQIESSALQSLVDLSPTFLHYCEISIPPEMVGNNLSNLWESPDAAETGPRSEILCENHHSPSLIHLKTMVTERYKLTVYHNNSFGELFDLTNDPGEHQNLWDDAAQIDQKNNLLEQMVWADLEKDAQFSAE